MRSGYIKLSTCTCTKTLFFDFQWRTHMKLSVSLIIVWKSNWFWLFTHFIESHKGITQKPLRWWVLAWLVIGMMMMMVTMMMASSWFCRSCTQSIRRKSICNSKDSTGKQGHIASKGLLKYPYYPWDWIESSQLKRNVLQTYLSPRWTTNLEPFWVLLGFVQTHDDLVSRFV